MKYPISKDSPLKQIIVWFGLCGVMVMVMEFVGDSVAFAAGNEPTIYG